MSGWIKRHLETPVFPVAYRARAAGLLNTILLSILATAALFPFFLTLLAAPASVLTFIVSAVSIGIILVFLILLRRGKLEIAGIGLSFFLFALVTFNLFIFGGVRNISGYFLVIIITALFMGGRAAVSFGLLSVLAVLGAIYTQTRGVVLAGRPSPVEVIDLLVIAPFLLLAALLLHFAVRSINLGFVEAQRNEERYRQLVEQVPAITYKAVLDVQSTTLYVSPQIENLLGITPDQCRADSDFWRKRLHPEDRERVLKEVNHCHETGEQLRCEYRMIAEDGRVVWFRDDAVIISENHGRSRLLQGTMLDITDRKLAEGALREAHEELELRVKERTAELANLNKELKRQIRERRQMEEKFIQSQKMEAVGRLAGGVAHDFNNLLTAITGYTDLLMKKTAADKWIHDRLGEIQKAADRAASLIHQLLAFSRKQILQPRPLNLNDVVTDIERMLRRVIGEDIKLSTVLEPELGLVEADPVQIEQVILNLAVNARDAMPSGGRLIIETANIELDQCFTGLSPNIEKGYYVKLVVSDTGIGMDKETRERLFEPFFTTKEKGKGTGLGLATIYGIVTQSGGNLNVFSEPGKGSTFEIYLPRLEKTSVTKESSSLIRKDLQGCETILVVEDEKMVLNLIQEVLTDKGYKVQVALDAEQALRISRKYRFPIHLLITDVVIPGGMSGSQLAKKLERSRPDIRILYISGYTDDAIVQHGILDREVAFLQKPFTPDDLALKVRQMLG